MAEQQILELTEADRQRLDDQRQLIVRYLDEDGRTKYQQPAGKLGTLRALLAAKVFSPDQTYELQSMGIVFGDAFVQEMGLHWVIVEDKYGRDPALRYKDTSIILFPLTMISKRVEAGEEVNVFDLFNDVAGILQERVREESSK